MLYVVMLYVVMLYVCKISIVVGQIGLHVEPTHLSFLQEQLVSLRYSSHFAKNYPLRHPQLGVRRYLLCDVNVVHGGGEVINQERKIDQRLSMVGLLVED